MALLSTDEKIIFFPHSFLINLFNTLIKQWYQDIWIYPFTGEGGGCFHLTEFDIVCIAFLLLSIMQHWYHLKLHSSKNIFYYFVSVLLVKTNQGSIGKSAYIIIYTSDCLYIAIPFLSVLPYPLLELSVSLGVALVFFLIHI